MSSKDDTGTRALIIDDEPEYLEWVQEYLEAKGLSVDYARDLDEALELVTTNPTHWYRVLLVDMNIPAPSGINPDTLTRHPLAQKYPGLAVASACRTLGYGAHAVVAYTVHDDDAADAELRKLHCRYVLKGRPEVLKRVLESSLAPAPPS